MSTRLSEGAIETERILFVIANTGTGGPLATTLRQYLVTIAKGFRGSADVQLDQAERDIAAFEINRSLDPTAAGGT